MAANDGDDAFPTNQVRSGMATAAAGRKRRLLARRAAVAGSLAAHLGIFGLLAYGWRSSPASPEPDEPAISVDLVRPLVRPTPRSSPAKPPKKRTSPTAAIAAAFPSLLVPSPAVAVTPTGRAAPTAPPGNARLSAALRGSLLGCANVEAANLTETEREACRHSLAQGARTAPYISNVPPEKRDYYAALSESEARMFQQNLGGHLPGILCGGDVKQRLGLKFGPCKLLAPMSPWTPEADVQPPR